MLPPMNNETLSPITIYFLTREPTWPGVIEIGFEQISQCLQLLVTGPLRPSPAVFQTTIRHLSSLDLGVYVLPITGIILVKNG